MPISRHARCTRSAISPRLAIRIFLNMGCPGSFWRSGRRGSWATTSLDDEQGLAVLDRLAVLDQDLGDRAGHVGLDLVHDLHGLDDADRVAFLDGAADVDERLRARARGA